MAKKQFSFKPGPQNVPTGGSRGNNSVTRAKSQGNAMTVLKPAQVRSAGISKSPTIDSVSGYTSAVNATNAGSGAYPKGSRYAVGASAPQEARTLTRAPAGWLK